MSMTNNRRRSSGTVSVLTILFIASLTMTPLSVAHTIKHVVYLMEENRSFDHLYGWAAKQLGINGLSGDEWNPTTTLDPSLAERVYVSRNASLIGLCDPDHALSAMSDKIYGLNQTLLNEPNKVERMDGFIEFELWNGKKNACYTLDMFDPPKLPVMMKLAAEYAIMDRMFCSVPGPTWPNRQFAMAATSGGSTETFNWYQGESGKLFPQKTFFDQLSEANLTWRNYYVDTPWELFMQSLANHPENIETMEHFKAAAASGDLPTYSFINPRSAINVTTGEGSNDMHPDHDMTLGELFVKEVYETLRASPAWNDTLLIVGFDENGGFYDHVLPPSVGVPPPDDIPAFPDVGFKFDRLGIRIPTLLISPWIEKGTVISEPPPAQKPFNTSEYELTSIMATVRKVLNLNLPPLTRRDAWAATFEHAVQVRDTPRTDCVKKLPKPLPASKEHAALEANLPLNGLQEFMIRTLADLHGYDAAVPPQAHARTQGEAGQWLQAHHESHHRSRRAYNFAVSQTQDLYDVVVAPLPSWIEGLLLDGAPFFDLNQGNEKNQTAGIRVTLSTREKLKSGNSTVPETHYCLDHRAGRTRVGTTPCYPSRTPGVHSEPSQLWDWLPDATLRPHGDHSLCVTTHVWHDDSAAKLEPCIDTVQQHWMYTGPAPGNGNTGTIQFGNGIYVLGVLPKAL